jgi:hypothetical protein
MIAKVHGKRVIVRGRKAVEITEFEGIRDKSNLPADYIDLDEPKPAFYNASCRIIKICIPNAPPRLSEHLKLSCEGKICWEVLHVGDVVPAEDFQAICVWLRRAGNRLAKINRKLAKENAGWEGDIVEAI